MADERTPTWYSDDRPVPPRPGLAGWLRVLLRGLPLMLVLGLGLLATLLLRPFERLASGTARPVTGRITVTVCRTALLLLGLRITRHGLPDRGAGAVVVNHASWLDILVLNAGGAMYFVSKAEVAGWPGLGWLARATGTVFIERSRAQARAHVTEVAARLATGHRLTLFPEGTSSDGARVLPFKPTLFQALATQTGLRIQPVSLRYTAPAGRDGRFYGWWGDMAFGPHALAVLAQSPQGQVSVRYHPSQTVTEGSDRKAMAVALQSAVQAGFDAT